MELRRPPSDSAYRYYFLQMNVASLFAAIRDLKIAQSLVMQLISISWCMTARPAEDLLNVQTMEVRHMAHGLLSLHSNAVLGSPRRGNLPAQGCHRREP